MIKQLFLTVVCLLIAWTLYERSKWDEDYSQYEAPLLNFGPIDHTFQSHINLQLFKGSKVISNKHLLQFPQDMAVSQNGTIYSGMEDGSIVQIDKNGDISILHKNNEAGGVFGIILANNDSTLFYVTQFKGLYSFDIVSKTQENLLSHMGQKRLTLNNLCLDEQNSTIYMTESTPFAMRHASKDILLKHKRGRILYYNLVTKQAGVFAEDLAYPNGIVYHKPSHSLIVSEMSHFKLTKIPLDDSSQKQTLVDNLFGYPDNLQLNDEGDLYVGIPAVRDESVQGLNQRPETRKLFMFVPQPLLTLSLRKIAGGIKVDPFSGTIKQYIFGDPSSVTYSVTTLFQRNGLLYMSSLRCPTIIVLNTSVLSKNQDAEPTPQNEL